MTGEHMEDSSFYDFLIEDAEVMSGSPSGHPDLVSQSQQPTCTTNRTSHEQQNPPSIRCSNFPAAPLPPLALELDRSRVASRPHSQLDLHAPNIPANVGFATQETAVSQHFPVDWGAYGSGVPQSAQFHASHFNFEIGPGMHAGQPIPPPHPIDPSIQYHPNLISPTNVHGHVNFFGGYEAHWGDETGPDIGTPTMASPAAPVLNNPWVETNDASKSGDSAENTYSDQHKRAKRQKKSGRRGSDSTAGPSSAENPSSPSSSQTRRASLGSKSTSIASSSTTSSRLSKLRSASRTSKNNLNNLNDSPEERRTRASHNLVEKQYRNRLNAQFESLLNALPEQLRKQECDDLEAPMSFEDKRVSKGEVLEMARTHIQTLERERDQLEREKNELLQNLNKTNKPGSEGTVPSRFGTPADFNTKLDEIEMLCKEMGNDEEEPGRSKSA